MTTQYTSTFKLPYRPKCPEMSAIVGNSKNTIEPDSAMNEYNYQPQPSHFGPTLGSSNTSVKDNSSSDGTLFSDIAPPHVLPGYNKYCTWTRSASKSRLHLPDSIRPTRSILASQSDGSLFAMLQDIREKSKKEHLQYLILDDRLSAFQRSINSKLSLLQGVIEMQAERIQSPEDEHDDDHSPSEQSCSTATADEMEQTDADLSEFLDFYTDDDSKADNEYAALISKFKRPKKKLDLLDAKPRGKKRKSEASD